MVIGGAEVPVALSGSRCRAEADEETEGLLDADVWRTDTSGVGLVRPQDR